MSSYNNNWLQDNIKKMNTRDVMTNNFRVKWCEVFVLQRISSDGQFDIKFYGSVTRKILTIKVCIQTTLEDFFKQLDLLITS